RRRARSAAGARRTPATPRKAPRPPRPKRTKAGRRRRRSRPAAGSPAPVRGRPPGRGPTPRLRRRASPSSARSPSPQAGRRGEGAQRVASISPGAPPVYDGSAFRDPEQRFALSNVTFAREYNAQSLERGLFVLAHLRDSAQASLSLAEIAAGVGLSKSTVHR